MKLIYLYKNNHSMNKQHFEVILLEEVYEFLESLDKKHAAKIFYNIRKSQKENDPELFKKLNEDIWEFRTLYQGLQYRLLAFWDKTDSDNTLVISTHGFIKKRSKVPDNEIIKAKFQKNIYFAEKEESKKKKK
jgi:phage-related protein